MLFPIFLATVQDSILGLVDLSQYSHFHVLLTQEIKETFPCEDGCNEQGIVHERFLFYILIQAKHLKMKPRVQRLKDGKINCVEV